MEERYSFSEALIMLKTGHRVTRSGWNGKGMFLFLVNGKAVTKAVYDCYGDPTHPETALPVLDAVYMKTADNKLVPWIASQSDLLANDWQLV